MTEEESFSLLNRNFKMIGPAVRTVRRLTTTSVADGIAPTEPVRSLYDAKPPRKRKRDVRPDAFRLSRLFDRRGCRVPFTAPGLPVTKSFAIYSMTSSVERTFATVLRATVKAVS
jgi:hypothetical protein